MKEYKINISEEIMNVFLDILQDYNLSLNDIVEKLAMYTINNYDIPEEILKETTLKTISSDYKKQLKAGGITGFDLEQLTYYYEQGVEQSKNE